MRKEVLKVCLPTMFSLMLNSLYSVIDGLFIGNQVGDVGLAAINIAWPISALVTALGVGIGIGGSILITQRRGLGEDETQIFQTTSTLLVLTALITTFFLFPTYEIILEFLGAKGETLQEAKNYSKVVLLGAIFQMFGAGIIPVLRNYNCSFLAMITMGVGTILNILINYFLICVYHLGIQGAAIGTAFSQCVVSILSLLILTKRLQLPLKPSLNMKNVKQILTVGLTGFGISLAPSISLMVTNAQCLFYGGDSAVAAYCVIAYIAFPAQAILTGIGDGTQPLISFYDGSGQVEKRDETSKFAQKLGLLISFILSFLVMSFSSDFATWFGLSDQGSIYFQEGLPFYALAFFLVFFVRFHICYLAACLKTRESIAFTLLESVILSPFLLFLLPFLLGMVGIWLSFPLSAILLLGLFFLTKKVNQVKS